MCNNGNDWYGYNSDYVTGRCHNGIYISAKYVLDCLARDRVLESVFADERKNFQLVIVGMSLFLVF